MKTIAILFLLALSLSLSGAEYYVATNGSDGNPGTISAPFASWDKLNDVLGPGDIGYIRGGTYYNVRNSSRFQCIFEDLHGTASDPIKIWAYPGETPVWNFTDLTYSNSPILVVVNNCDYVHFKGLRLTNAQQPGNGSPVYGWNILNSDNNTLENITIDHIGGYGFLIGQNMGSYTNNELSEYNLFLNCDAYAIADPRSPSAYTGSNGFNIIHNSGESNAWTPNTTFRGCRTWFISDDGFDLMGCEGLPIHIENCWAFWCGLLEDFSNPGGDGVGFKLGPPFRDMSEEGYVNVKNCIAAQNTSHGFFQNTNNYTMAHRLYNNFSYDNYSGYNFHIYAASILRNNLEYGNDVSTSLNSSMTNDHNSWNGGVNVTESDFRSLDVSQLARPRKADGSLPDIDFGHLTEGSDIIDKGVDVGLGYNGGAPDLGAFEYGTYVPPPPPPDVPVCTGIDFNEGSPNIVELYFNLSLTSSVVPTGSDFTVVLNGSTNFNVTSVNINGTTVRLTLANAVTIGGTLSVSYSKTGVNTLQTPAGGEVASFTKQTNVNLEGPPPEGEFSVRIFQFPTGNYIAVHIGGPSITEPYFIRFYDASGALVYEDTLTTNASRIPIIFPLGVYQVDIGLNNQTLHSQKIVLN
jgi:hypothetical protein